MFVSVLVDKDGILRSKFQSLLFEMSRVMLMQTWPSLVQARILSFLVYDYQRFCTRDLGRLARSE